MRESMLSTIDNPYNPFNEFDPWYSWDTHHGYNTTSFLARVVQFSPTLSPLDQHLEIERAIDEIVKENVTGVYVKVTREIPGTSELETVGD